MKYLTPGRYRELHFGRTKKATSAPMAFSNLGSLLKSVFGNSVISKIFFTSDYLEETPIIDQIDAIRSYGITNFCEQIKIDDQEDGIDKINKLIDAVF